MIPLPSFDDFFGYMARLCRVNRRVNGAYNKFRSASFGRRGDTTSHSLFAGGALMPRWNLDAAMEPNH
jgi:hypothetical protein